MRKILIIVQKEFRQIFRNKMMKPILFVMPILQLAVLSYTADFTVKDINIFIEDKDNSGLSKELINKISASENFNLLYVSNSFSEGFKHIQKNEVDIILSIPEHFNRNFNSNKKTDLSISADAINSVKAGISINYLQNIIMEFTQEIIGEKGFKNNESGIQIIKRDWYNPSLDYKYFMVPGILVLLVTMNIIENDLCGLNK